MKFHQNPIISLAVILKNSNFPFARYRRVIGFLKHSMAKEKTAEKAISDHGLYCQGPSLLSTKFD